MSKLVNGRSFLLLLGALFAIGVSCARPGGDSAPHRPWAPPDDPEPGFSAGAFTENAGQLSRGDILFHGRAGGLRVGFAIGGVYLHGRVGAAGPARTEAACGPRGVLLHLGFRGARPVAPVASDPAGHRTHFLVGPDPARWRTGLGSFHTITYPDLYEGVDLVFRGTPGGLKYDVRLAPGADLSQVALAVEGAEGLDLDSLGRLVIRTAIGDVLDAAPVALDGPREIASRYEVLGPDAFGFRCDGWRGDRPLVVDPLIWSAFEGGTFGDLTGAMAVDADDGVYVTGTTASTDFPDTTGPYDDILDPATTTDAFVMKVASDGTIDWRTFFGGSEDEHARGIGVDGARNVTISGFTYSNDIPAGPPNMYRDHYSGETPATFTGDTYVAKLTPDGASIVYRTYLGPSRIVGSFFPGGPLVVDTAGNAYVGTATASAGFFTGSGAPGYDQTYEGGSDAVILKLNTFGTGIFYGTYLGGSAYDFPTSLHLGRDDTLYVSGWTDSWQDFPLVNPVQDQGKGGRDFFVCQLTGAGTDLLFSTYVGGTFEEDACHLAVDVCGEVYVAGTTSSTDFPRVDTGYQGTYGGANRDGVVFRLDESGFPLVSATFLGGGLNDHIEAADIDGAGNIYLTGRTNSDDFPTMNPLFSPGSLDDAFLVRLDATLGQLVDSTRFGGSNDDHGRAIVVRGNQRIHLAGQTNSADFPGHAAPAGNHDVFVMKVGLDAHAVPHGLGWWKRFLCRWNLQLLSLGGKSYFKGELIDLLKRPSRGDASVILAHQLIPAKLNVAMGVDDGPIAVAIAEADRLLGLGGRRLPLELHPPDPGAQAMLELKGLLEDFNEGRLGR